MLGCGHTSHILKKHLIYFSKSSSRLPGIDQTNKHVVKMTKEGSTIIVNFMTPGARGLVLGCGHICHYSEYVLSSTLSTCFSLIAIVMKDNEIAYLYHC